MKPTEGEETQREVEEELARRGSTPSLAAQQTDEEAGHEEEMRSMNPIPEETMTGEEVEEAKEEKKPKRKSLHVQIREKSWFGKKCVKVFRVFSNTFAMTFLAEWGDRSQLATIVMAGINDVGGVCVGGVLGHLICTGLAGNFWDALIECAFPAEFENVKNFEGTGHEKNCFSPCSLRFSLSLSH